MSTDAQGSTPNYRDSVRDMMRELKATKGSGKAPTVAAAVAVAKVVEDKSSDNLHVVGKVLSDFPQEDSTTDESTEPSDDKKLDNDNEENTKESVELLDVTDEKVNSDSSNVEMVNIDAPKEDIETDSSVLEGAVKFEVNGDVSSEVNIDNVSEDVDPLSSADSQVDHEISEQTDLDVKTETKAEPEPDETTTNPLEDEQDKLTSPKQETKASENGDCVEHADVETEPEVLSETAENSAQSDPLMTDPEEEISSESKKVENDNKSPEVVNLSDDDDVEEEGEDDNDDEEDEVGNPDRPPGEDAVRDIEPDHLLPFHHGWRREVVMRKGNGQVATQYDISYLPPDNGQYRTREAKRKRTSKTDQDKYFADFPSPVLSIRNFTYVRRPLGINNAAYEIIRKGGPALPETDKPTEKQTPSKTTTATAGGSGASTSGAKGRRVSSYREVEESVGLLDEDSNNDTDDEVVCINGFDVIAPISLQVNHIVLGLRAENKKRHKRRDPETCCTPPLAEDSLWSGLDDDPMGIYNELGGRSSPTTPPPLRAVLLTPIETAEKIVKRYSEVHEIASKRDFLKEQELQDNMASHDYAIRKFKNFKEQRYSGGFVSSFGQQFQRRGDSNSRYSHSLIMKPALKPALDQMRQLPGISWSSSSTVRNNLRTCSMQCPGTGGVMPDLQCISCQRLYHARCQGAAKQARMFKCRLCRTGGLTPESRVNKETIRMKLPMHPVNGKRPVVELVMLQNGRYQPIKFSNNIQVTETIPKAMFEQANLLRKTVYQKATQVPRVGNNSIYIAVNPTQRMQQLQQQQQPQRTQSSTATASSQQPKSFSSPAANSNSASSSEQVSILVRPHKGGKQVLLNVPRKIALKVKNGTTLSFSASNDQKYVVVSNKIHPPVGPAETPQQRPASTSTPSSQNRSSSFQQQQRPRPSPGTSSSGNKIPSNVFAGILPASVSLEPINKGQSKQPLPVNRRRPAVSVSINRTSELGGPVAKARKIVPGGSVLSSGEIISSSSTSALTPCTPYCPGVSGFPELECSGCQSLFHLKCVGIPQAALPKIKNSFRCRMCVQRKTSGPKPASLTPASSSGSTGNVQVIDLD